MIQKIKNAIRILLTPGCWMRNHKTCKLWDARLNSLLDNQDFEIDENGYTIYFPKSNITVWIENYPYASGSFYGGAKHRRRYHDRLPTRETVFRLYDMVLQRAQEEFIQEISE